MNERAGRQEREEMMSMIQNARPPSDHLPPMNERTRLGEPTTAAEGSRRRLCREPPHAQHTRLRRELWPIEFTKHVTYVLTWWYHVIQGA